MRRRRLKKLELKVTKKDLLADSVVLVNGTDRKIFTATCLNEHNIQGSETIDEDIIKCCRNCSYMRDLKHDFVLGVGYKESACCVVDALSNKDNYVKEVKLNDTCSEFSKRSLKYDVK